MVKRTRPPLTLPWDYMWHELDEGGHLADHELRDAHFNGLLPSVLTPSGPAVLSSVLLNLWPHLRISSDGVITSNNQHRHSPAGDAPQKRSRPELERIRPVVCELWGPDGPPEHLSDGQVRRALNSKLEKPTNRSAVRRLRGRE
jgi:hypothetical protein